MSRKSVAVLDVRSGEIALVVGEKGVNKTIVFKTVRREPYEGYGPLNESRTRVGFYDESKLKEIVARLLASVEQVCGKRLKDVYIGVPGAFCENRMKWCENVLPKRRKISSKEVCALYEGGVEQVEDHRFIRATSSIFLTADNRRVVNPIGIASASLKGLLTYFYCSKYFMETFKSIFDRIASDRRQDAPTLHFLPTELAVATYLIPPETRDEVALVLDVGYLSTSIMVCYGNGIYAQETAMLGKATVACRIIESVRYPDLGFEDAVALLERSNLHIVPAEEKREIFVKDKYLELDLSQVYTGIRDGLDEICEFVSGFFDRYGNPDYDCKSLFVTGEGLFGIRGALERISRQISRVCEPLAPELPEFNSPSMSSLVSLVDMAYADHNEGGDENLLNGFGG